MLILTDVASAVIGHNLNPAYAVGRSIGVHQSTTNNVVLMLVTVSGGEHPKKY